MLSEGLISKQKRSTNEHIPEEWLESLSSEEYWIEEYDVSDESIREENFDMREGVFDAILHFFEFGGA